MTIGIVWVACLAARIEERSKDKDIDLELHEFSHLAWNLIQLSLTVAIINQNVFALNITEIAQSLSECISEHMGSGGGGAGPLRQKSDSRNFLRLLRLKENSVQSWLFK